MWRRLRLPIGSVARDMATVGTATALGQVALVVAAPFLARLFTPEAFGYLSIYLAVIAVIAVVASLRFEFAIPLASDTDEAAHLASLSIVMGLAMSLILGVVLFALGPQLAERLGLELPPALIWLAPAALFVTKSVESLSALATQQRTFSTLGRARAVQGLTQAATQVALGAARVGAVGLVIGDLVGRIVSLGGLVAAMVPVLRSADLSARMMGAYARKRWGFARIMTSASILNTVSLQGPFLFIPALFDLGLSGQYFIAHRLLILPASLVGAGVSQVFLGEASHRLSLGQGLRVLTRNAAISLLVFAVPTYTMVAVGGSALFVGILGVEWALAGTFAQILAPWLLISSVASPLSTLLLLGRRERESLAFTAVELALKTTSLVVGAALGSLVAGLVLLSFVSVVVNAAALWRILRVAQVAMGEIAMPAARILGLCLPSAGLVMLVGLLAPELVPIACALGWVLGFALAARHTPQLQAMLSESG